MATNITRILHVVVSPKATLASILIKVLAVAGATAVLSSEPALAHHSSAKFDGTREVVLEGTVRRMEWTNPHVWIRLEVVDDQGNVVEWGVEGTNPLALGRMGWSRNTFRPGDKVTIVVSPAKDGRPYGGFVRATLADGTLLSDGALIDAEERDRDGSE